MAKELSSGKENCRRWGYKKPTFTGVNKNSSGKRNPDMKGLILLGNKIIDEIEASLLVQLLSLAVKILSARGLEKPSS